ncbi:unnamed protein product [Rotaria magnacalcarata]|uniref:SWIM-type domain-containing protein n=3 Tax=Rotaria magnacalcarata TaxID=392030 RepID=A0A816BN30_9BILA|nr:unnamed protein product [Rotaria magnacalcarata]CAF4059960.1 unnamed protein product [Rotaria magnacalcarata]
MSENQHVGMDKSNKRSCCFCEKRFRVKERIRSLESYQSLCDFLTTNKLVHLHLHNSCYMTLYNKKRNAEGLITQSINQQMKIDVETQTDGVAEEQMKIDIGTQTKVITEKQMNQYENQSTSSNGIQLPFYRLPKSNKICSICGKSFSSKSISCQEINQSTRVQCLLDHNIYIPIGNRCCLNHHSENGLSIQSIEKLKTNKENHCTIKRDDLIIILNDMKEELQTKDSKIDELKQNPPLNFDDNGIKMSDTSFKALTGLNQDQLNDLCSHISASALRHTDIRSPRTTITCLLIKLRLGVSHQTLCTLFSIEDVRKMSRILDSASSALIKYFVPKHLGFDHINRSEVINHHTRPHAKILLGDDDPNKAILILDGTYCYIQKSGNNLLQRRTYSLHKGKPLVKPMMIVASDGYIISAIGPFLADRTHNDAEITKNIIYNNKEGITDWLRSEDHIIVDRGFRDCVKDLENFGYKVKMPCFLKKGQSRFTTNEAHQTRFITKIRWVVESANGGVKQWQFFNKTIPNSMIEKIGDYFRMKKYNKVSWTAKEANDAALDFPKMDFNELQELTLGIYQPKQARSYTTEHLNLNGSCTFEVAKESPDLIRSRIQSRLKASTKYDVYVPYNKKSISGWYCTCPNGARVVGCCAHVASIIYYLSYARYNQQVLTQRTYSYYDSITDALDYSEPSDTDSIDSDDENSNILYTLV